MKTCSGAKFFNYFKIEYLTWRIICTLQYILTKSEWTEKLSIFFIFLYSFVYISCFEFQYKCDSHSIYSLVQYCM